MIVEDLYVQLNETKKSGHRLNDRLSELVIDTQDLQTVMLECLPSLSEAEKETFLRAMHRLSLSLEGLGEDTLNYTKNVARILSFLALVGRRS